MSIEFAVSFKSELVIRTPDNDIVCVSVDNTVIGFISVARKHDTDNSAAVITPFTVEGLLPDVCCIGGAAKALFAQYTGLSANAVSLAETAKSGTLAALFGAFHTTQKPEEA